MEQVRLNYKGREVSELTKEELLVAIADVFKDSEEWKERYYKAENDKMGFMSDMVKLKLQNL